MGAREDIDGAADCQGETVTVPEWNNVTLRVAMLSHEEREDFDFTTEQLRKKSKGDADWYRGYRLRLLVLALRNPDGTRIYQPGEEGVLGRRSSRVLGRLFDIADRLNALTERAVEERAGKSGAAHGGASSTDSASPSAASIPTTSSEN